MIGTSFGAVPCSPHSTLCSPLKEFVPSGRLLCEKMGVEVRPFDWIEEYDDHSEENEALGAGTGTGPTNSDKSSSRGTGTSSGTLDWLEMLVERNEDARGIRRDDDGITCFDGFPTAILKGPGPRAPPLESSHSSSPSLVKGVKHTLFVALNSVNILMKKGLYEASKYPLVVAFTIFGLLYFWSLLSRMTHSTQKVKTDWGTGHRLGGSTDFRPFEYGQRQYGDPIPAPQPFPEMGEENNSSASSSDTSSD
eukprot:GHVN01103174.1.p1 GENE.GHVN01103174.1~~GHVN01103174.1.p1  ORF type:complete len:251 (+),score=58.26 GHVN01103174.1:186-938(+)